MRIYYINCDKCGIQLESDWDAHRIDGPDREYDLCEKCFSVFKKKHHEMTMKMIKEFAEFNAEKIIEENKA